jgi:Agglutinin C-terminal
MKEKIYIRRNNKDLQIANPIPDTTPIIPNKMCINRKKLRNLILKTLGDKLYAKHGEFDLNNGLFIADSKYYCPPHEDAKEIIYGSKIIGMTSEARRPSMQRFDCDDFSLLLKARFAYAAYRNERKRNFAHCFGIVWGMLPFPFSHSLNWMVTTDKKGEQKFHFVEPQTYEIISPNQENFQDIYFMLV